MNIRLDPENFAHYQLLPPLSPEEFKQLEREIARAGVLVPVVCDEDGRILDGHHRVQACIELGIPLETIPVMVQENLDEGTKRYQARILNTARRHLSRNQIGEIICAQLMETPELSDRKIAADLNVDNKTVARHRRRLEESEEITRTTKRTGQDGRRRAKKPNPAPLRQNAQPPAPPSPASVELEPDQLPESPPNAEPMAEPGEAGATDEAGESGSGAAEQAETDGVEDQEDTRTYNIEEEEDPDLQDTLMELESIVGDFDRKVSRCLMVNSNYLTEAEAKWKANYVLRGAERTIRKARATLYG